MDVAQLIAMLVALAPGAPFERLAPVVEAIAATDATPHEAAELVATDWAERSFGLRPRARGVPFGLSCCRRDAATLETAAARALAILRAGRAQCGPAPARRHHYFRLGVCGVDGEAQRRARLVARLRRVRF